MCSRGFCGRAVLRRSGFTIIEACLAIAIVGMGFAAVMQLLGACSMATAEAANRTVGVLLQNNVQELLAPVPYTQLASYDGVSYGADSATAGRPVDASGQALVGLDQYTQHISVVPVSHKDLTTAAAKDEGVCRVLVQVLHRAPGSTSSGPVCSLSFLRFDDK